MTDATLTTLRGHMLLMWLVVFWLDGWITFIGVSYLGLDEINPIARAVLSLGLPGIVLAKVVGSVIEASATMLIRPDFAILLLVPVSSSYIVLFLHNVGVVFS